MHVSASSGRRARFAGGRSALNRPPASRQSAARTAGREAAGQAPIRSRSRYWSRARSSARVRGSADARRDSTCGRGSAGVCDSAWRTSPRLGPPGPRRQTRHPSVSWVCWASSAAREGSVKRRPSARVRYPSALRTASWSMPRRALRHTRAAGVSTLEATTARARAAGAPGATVGLAPSTGAAERWEARFSIESLLSALSTAACRPPRRSSTRALGSCRSSSQDTARRSTDAGAPP